MYEQKNGVSIGASLMPVLANIIMTECEKSIVDNIVKKGTIKFYVSYVDDCTVAFCNKIGAICNNCRIL